MSLWEVKELVRDLGYRNNVRCWYNVGDNPHNHVIPLNSDANVVDFLNIVSNYTLGDVHLYVEHIVDNAIMVEEHFFSSSS